MTSATSNPREERLHELIAEYLDREAEGRAPDRAAWLAEHADLAGELGQFLDEHAHLARVGAPLRALAEPVSLPADAATLAGNGAATEVSPAVVRSFGDYELLQEIARGGMGVVYKSRQKSLNRLVALKMILAGQFAGETDVQRFQSEATAAGQLDHPNIVPVFEVGEHDGQHYFSMKLIEGDNLARAIAADRWPRATSDGQQASARLIMATARAVHYAHQRGILHRDLKPGNILLSARSDRLQAVASSAGNSSQRPVETGHYEPHVTDFGLAKRVGGDSSLTNTGAVVGTPAYMPPEQASGNKQLTIAADVYSLGAILFEMLTGRPPFVGDSALSILSQVSTDEPSRPRGLNPALDRDLETICLKCLDKDPGRRYTSAEALADDLSRWLSGEPIEARSATTWERTVKWAKRRPAVAALVGVSIVSAAALLIGGLVFNAQLGFALERVNQQEQDLKQAHTDVAEAKKDVAQQQTEAKGANALAKEFLAEATSLRLVARSEVARASDPALALLLALEGAKAPRRGLDQNNALAAAIDACRETGPLLRTDIGHPVAKVRWFADGRRALTVDYHTVRIWDTQSGKQLVTFNGPQLRINSVAISPDDRRIALTFQEHFEHVITEVAGKVKNRPFVVTDEAVRIYDADTGIETQVLRGHRHRVVSVAFSADSKRVLTASWDRTARIWDPESGKELHKLEGHECALASADFTADGRVLTVSAGITKSLKQPRHQYAVNRLNLAPNAIDPPLPAPFRSLGGGYSGGDGGGGVQGEAMFACLWDPKTGAKVREFRTGRRGELSFPLAATLSPDVDRPNLLAALEGGAVMYQDPETAAETRVWSVKDEVLRGHPPRFSADGKRALIAYQRSVHVWDAQSGQIIAALRGHTDAITGARFSPDAQGQFVLTTSDDGTVRVWETATGIEQFSLRGHEQAITDLDFHPSGRHIITGSRDGTARLWNIAPSHGYGRTMDEEAQAWWITPQGLAQRTNRKDRKAIWAAALSPDGTRVAAGYFDGTLRLWDAATGKLISSHKGYEKAGKLQRPLAGEIIAVAFNHDGSQLLTVASDPRVTLIGANLKPLEAESARMPYQPVRIYDAATGELVAALEGHREGVRSARFSPDGTRILTVADTQFPTRSFMVDKNGNIRAGGGSGNSSGKDRTARIYDAKTGKELHVFTDDWKEIYTACWDAKGQRVCTIHENFTWKKNNIVELPAIRIWDVQTGQCTHKLRDPRNMTNSAAFSPDGRRLLTWHEPRIRAHSNNGSPSEARVWDLASGKILFSLKGSHDKLNHAAYSPNGRWIVTTAHAYNQSTSSGALGLHGRYRDNNDHDRTVRLWDAETGALTAVFHGHAQSVHWAEFSKDSRWLVTASEDRTARVWEVATGKEVITLRGHDDDVKLAHFGPDAKTVLTVSWDGTARLWPVDPLPIAEQRRPRELTENERERFELQKN